MTIAWGTTTAAVRDLSTTDATKDAAKDAAQHAKLVDAAQQFEGMLLQEMLKGMQSSKDGEDSSSGGNDTLQSFGTEAVAHAIAQRGGVGIAKQVIEKVTIDRGHDARRS